MMYPNERWINENELNPFFVRPAEGEINLTIGQPDWSPTSELIKSARSFISETRYSHPQGVLALRERIAREYSFVKKPENVVVTCGTSAGVVLALSACVNPGDEILYPDPSFSLYKNAAKLLNIQAIPFNTYPSFIYSLDEIKKKKTAKTRAIILNSPGNPTGIIQPKSVLREITAWAFENGIMILSDEVYLDLTLDKKFSPGSEFENVITINGFSKSLAVPGWRVGWASGPSKIIQAMTNMNAFFTVGTGTPFQLALAHSPWKWEKPANELAIKRAFISTSLETIFDFNKPEGAFYLFAKDKKESGTVTTQKLKEHGVLVVPGTAFSNQDTHFRLSYANSMENLQEAVERMVSCEEEF